MAEIAETLVVEGVHCMNCVQKIGEAIREVDGLRAASANLAGEVAIRYDEAEPQTRAAVVDALAGAGFPVTSASAS
jgi:copper chaperone CopZ